MGSLFVDVDGPFACAGVLECGSRTYGYGIGDGCIDLDLLCADY